MIVMPANQRGLVCGWLAGRFPQRIGHLYSPGGLTQLYPFIPFALDNGRFAACAKQQEWDEAAYLGMLDRVASDVLQPRWLLVPDVVADHEGTWREWDRWAHRLSSTYRWPLAFAVQDGMEPDDVPKEASVVFVGGSTEWKRRTLHDWCEHHSRVHVGRINTNRWLWECDEAGAESCDGTGWFRGDQQQLQGLVDYLERSVSGLGNQRGPLLWNSKMETSKVQNDPT
jgi:hypothetical protein